MHACVASLLLVIACSGQRAADVCARVAARIESSWPPGSKERFPMLAESRAASVQQCRAALRDPSSSIARDPVLRCAMDSESDALAAACMDAVVERTLTPASGAAPVGRNPLLQPP